MTRHTTVVVLSVVAGLAVLALLGLRYLGGPGASGHAGHGPEAGATHMKTGTLVRPHSPVIGPATAPVTIVEFLDPACEACRAFHPYVKQILGAYPGTTRLVIRYVPFHGDISVEGVRILEAAREQGRFEAVLEALLESQATWASHGKENPQQAWEVARAAGLELDRARALVATGVVEPMLEQEVEDVTGLNVTGTPTFFVNGRQLSRSDPESLLDLVKSEMARFPLAP